MFYMSTGFIFDSFQCTCIHKFGYANVVVSSPGNTRVDELGHSALTLTALLSNTV